MTMLETKTPAFPYNYNSLGLKGNRFTDYSILERIYQRFGEILVQNEFGIYAFSNESKKWNELTQKEHGILKDLYNLVIEDIFADEHFISVLCVNSKGQPSLARKQKAEEHFSSHSLYKKTAEQLLTNKGHRLKYIHADEFDNAGNLLMVKNGVLDLRTGELREPEASDLLLGASPVMWDENARCPEWLEFLNEVFSESEDREVMIDFLQELFGYTISGDISEQKIFCHYGTGANGKSKVLSALKMLGGSFAVYVAPDDFSNLGSYGTKFERFGSKAKGKRIVIVDDLEVGGIWNESLIKAVTAPYFMARSLYKEAIEVRNHAAFHIGLNEPPKPQAENFGLLRRICLIPYLKQFEPNNASSKRIDSMIAREISGILKWAQEGYMKVYHRGTLLYPEEINTAVQEYKEDFFILHNVISTLYAPSESDEDFRFTYEIENDVKQYLTQKGIFKKVSLTEILNTLKQIFRIQTKKKWSPERQNAWRGMNLKLLYDVGNPKNVF